MADIPVGEDLAGKVALVAGGGAQPGEGVGNGRAACLLFARAGARVCVADAILERAEETKRMIEANGGEAIAVKCDVTILEDCKAAVDACMSRWGRLDALVNNVGIGGPKGTAETVDLEAWSRGLQINVTGMVLMSRFAVPAMRKSGGGAIVNISSVAGLKGGYPHLLYPTSKGAVVNMTRAMAVHHAPDKIRVNCVCPGMVYTPMVQQGLGASRPAVREARKNRSVLKTEGSGWDVGAAVVFLCSGNSRWMTGTIVPVDAGATAAVGVEGAPTTPGKL
ncbi:putative short-chain dehydrogenase/reductase [Hyaloraphidium curvatum]|nr:putative short-chain dehydrogenase/reductase [Hyaloraphidium curvatum]